LPETNLHCVSEIGEPLTGAFEVSFAGAANGASGRTEAEYLKIGIEEIDH